MALPGPKTAAARLKLRYFKQYQDEIIRLLKRQRGSATESDDAGLLLDTYDANKLLKPARDLLAAHIARTDNPHQETMTSIGSYTAETIASKIKSKIPNAVLPISTYGIFDNLDNAAVNAAWSGVDWKLTCKRDFNIILSGTSFMLPATTLDLAEFGDPANKIFYVYVRGVFGVFTYEARTDSPPESSGVMYIGKVVCGANGIVSTSFKTVVSLNTFRLSDEPVGSAIPVTKGTFDAVTPLPATWKPL